MAKSKKKVQQKGKKARPRMQRIGGTNVILDKAAMDHIKLMADPCQGKLVPAAYASPGGGAIIRLKTVVSLATAAGETAGAFTWAPGSNEYSANGAVSPTTTFGVNGLSMFPVLQTVAGAGNSARTFRCVAACVRVMPYASEMNRSGFVWAGQTYQSYLARNSGSQTNVQTVAASLPVMTRVPSKMVEILWVPTVQDQDFTVDMDDSSYSIGSTEQQHSAITIAVGGLQATTGVAIEVTGVYEINFPSQLGYVSALPTPVSSTPWNQILGAFYKVIHNAPVIVDTARRITEYIGAAAASEPGRLVAGAARLALTAA